MPFRMVAPNLEQDHQRWAARRPLIIDEIVRLPPPPSSCSSNVEIPLLPISSRKRLMRSVSIYGIAAPTERYSRHR